MVDLYEVYLDNEQPWLKEVLGWSISASIGGSQRRGFFVAWEERGRHGASNKNTILLECEELPSIELAQEACPADKGKGKMPVEQGDERIEPFDDKSDSDFDPKEHEIINCGTSQIEVNVEGVEDNHDTGESLLA